MVWSHYLDETYAEDEFVYDEECEVEDEEREPPQRQMTLDDWSTWYSRDLLNMWMSLRSYTVDAGVSSYLLTDASFPDFCEFVYNFSHGYPSPHPS